MKLTVVGSSGSFPGPDSPASCYLVEHDGHRVLLDLGNGALGAVQRYTSLYEIDAVILSHLHVDHCIDVCSYYVARRYRPEGPAPLLPVLGPTGTGPRLARAYDLPHEPGMTGEFDFRDHQPVTEIGPFRISTTRVAHPVETYAIRVEAGGHSIVYSADTGPTPALVDLARGADLALFEASFMDGNDNPPGLHLTAGESAEHAARAGVGELVLTHLVAWNTNDVIREQASSRYDGALSLAQSGDHYRVS